MADTDEEEGAAIVLGLHELLLEVHQELLQGHTTSYAAHQKCQMDMGEGAGSGLPRTKEMYG